MGYYTEFKFKAKLAQNTPSDVIYILCKGLIHKTLCKESALGQSDQFFKCQRWLMIFSGGRMYKNKKYWEIELQTELKNYDDEIGKFIKWISPFVVCRKSRQHVGYRAGEGGEGEERKTFLYI